MSVSSWSVTFAVPATVLPFRPAKDPDFCIISEVLGLLDELALGFGLLDDMLSCAPLLQELSETARAAAERTVAMVVAVLRMMRSDLRDDPAGIGGCLRR